jgi:Helicase HerA, central domain
MHSLDALGTFYLGREVDSATGQDLEAAVLYDSRDLTTHAVCLGMTGSGKTGLCLSLLEEAALDGVPTIALDPKGDLGNLLLTFPELRGEDFAAWIDPAEAARKGMTPEAFATKTAETWRDGLAEWQQDGARIQRFRDAADVLLYTPGSESGRPLSILRSFSAPPAELRNDAGALRDRITTSVSGLLGLVGIDADPLQSREHILLSTILSQSWSKGEDLELASVIQAVQKPPFDKVGVFDLETFYPAKDRLQLAMALNNLIAAPGFDAWTNGDPLDIQKLLYAENGKPRISIISIAHLNDAERMFVVTLVLGELVAWMRRQSGTSSLRALLYMDEIFGYFPPTAMPPSKLPLLTLMKQARAFGVGVVLATQNPVDLDYKGLSNAGTWFIGRLQTERDKARVIDGLLSAGQGGQDKSTLEKLLGSLGNRVFLLQNAHEDRPILFRTRWALSYLRGPLTLQEIAKLTPQRDASTSVRKVPDTTTAQRVSTAPASSKAIIPAAVREYYCGDTTAALPLAAQLLGFSRVHFVDGKLGIDAWETRAHWGTPRTDGAVEWSEAKQPATELRAELRDTASPGAQYQEANAGMLRAASYSQWKKELQSHIQQNDVLKVLRCPAAAQSMAPGDNESEFRARIALSLREKRDAQIEKIKQKFGPKLSSLEDQRRRAEDRMEREKAQLSDRKMQSAVSIGTSLLGALLGRKRISVTNMSRVGSAARSAGRVTQEQDDVKRAEESLDVLTTRYEALEREFQQEIEEVQREFDPSIAQIEEVLIRPRKSDTEVMELAVVWKATAD